MVLAQDLRDAVLQTAIQGRLTERLSTDGNARDLLKQIKTEKDKLIADKKIKKEKALAPISDDEKPFEIPDNWEWCRFGYISTYAETKTKINAQSANKDDWMLDLEDIEKGGKLLKKTKVSDKKATGDKTVFKKGNILYSKLRPYLLKVLIADEDGICTPELIPFDMYGKINTEYVVYFLKSPYVDSEINRVTYGVKMPRVGTDTMTSFAFPLPPLPEQERIVAKVDELMKEIDELEKIENELESIKKAFPGDMKDALLQAAMQGKLTEQLPTDSSVDDLIEKIKEERKKLEDEGKIKKTSRNACLANSCDDAPFEIPSNWKWIAMERLVNINCGSKDANYGTKNGIYPFFTCSKDIIKAPNYSFDGECLLLPGNGANVGKVFYYNGKFEAYQRTYVLEKVYKNFNMLYLQYVLLWNWENFNLNKMKGSAIPYITLSNLQTFLVPLPPIEEQKRIVEVLDKLLPLIQKL